MIKTIKPNTLPYPGCKIYPDYEFKSNNIAGTILSQLRSYIPISRDGDLYLIPFETSLESVNTTDCECDCILKPALLEDLEFHAKEMSKRYKLPNDNEPITIYKYEKN